jgi:hypothetical protein
MNVKANERCCRLRSSKRYDVLLRYLKANDTGRAALLPNTA